MPGKHYTLSERNRIAELAQSGLGATAIARKLTGRTPGGVQSQVVKLGFIDVKRSAAAKARQSREMNPQQHKQFRDFLRSGIDRAPPIELMRHWNEQASRHRLPTVSIDMVDYWIDKLRIRLSPEAAAVNRAYQEVRQLRNLKRGATARATFESRAGTRRRELLQLRAEMLQQKPRMKQWLCPDCGESWPLTTDFYRAKVSATNGKLYFEARGCILCVNRVRRRVSELRSSGYDPAAIRRMLKAEERRRRNRRAQAVIAQAQKIRDSMLPRGKSQIVRTCLDCHEDWPLVIEFWKPAANGAYPRFCRFCDARYRREQQRARADGQPLGPIRAARRLLLDDAHDQERRAKRKELQTQATQRLRRSKKEPSRTCSLCQTLWPLSQEFWLFEPDDGPRAGKLARTYCRCCSHDKDALSNRYRKRRSKRSLHDS